MTPNALAACDTGLAELDFAGYCDDDPYSDTGQKRAYAERITGNLTSETGIRLSRLGEHQGVVFDLVVTFAAEAEDVSVSNLCDDASCILQKICEGARDDPGCSTQCGAFIFKVAVGTRATLGLEFVVAGTDTAYSIPGTYLSWFDIDGETDGAEKAEALAVRGADVTVEDVICTSCGGATNCSSGVGNNQDSKRLWKDESPPTSVQAVTAGYVEISAREHETDGCTARSDPNCPGCDGNLSNIYGYAWSQDDLDATVSVKLTGPFSKLYLDLSMRVGNLPTTSANNTLSDNPQTLDGAGLVINGPGPLVGECVYEPPPPFAPGKAPTPPHQSPDG